MFYFFFYFLNFLNADIVRQRFLAGMTLVVRAMLERLIFFFPLKSMRFLR